MEIKECVCKKPSEFTRIEVKFVGKERLLIETCMNCNRKVREPKHHIPVIAGVVATFAIFIYPLLCQ